VVRISSVGETTDLVPLGLSGAERELEEEPQLVHCVARGRQSESRRCTHEASSNRKGWRHRRCNNQVGRRKQANSSNRKGCRHRRCNNQMDRRKQETPWLSSSKNLSSLLKCNAVATACRLQCEGTVRTLHLHHVPFFKAVI